MVPDSEPDVQRLLRAASKVVVAEERALDGPEVLPHGTVAQIGLYARRGLDGQFSSNRPPHELLLSLLPYRRPAETLASSARRKRCVSGRVPPSGSPPYANFTSVTWRHYARNLTRRRSRRPGQRAERCPPSRTSSTPSRVMKSRPLEQASGRRGQQRKAETLEPHQASTCLG
jgi:hypothetical protein